MPDNTASRMKFKDITIGAQYFIILLIVWFFVGGYLLFQENERSIYKAINDQHTSFKDSIFPYLTHIGEATVIIPCLLLLLFIKPLRNRKFALAMIACNVSPFLITQAIKAIINAPRPLRYFTDISFIHRVTGQPENYNYSFPSGHSEGSFAFLCFLALLLPARYRILGIVLFIVGLIVLYSRIYLSQHFFRDVYVGSLIGAISCLICFWLINPFKSNSTINKTHPQNA